MKRPLQIAILVAVAAAGWFAWSWLFPTNEQKIKRLLADLAEDVSFTGKEGNIAHAMAIESLMSHLHPDVEIFAENPYENRMESVSGRETIRRYMTWFRKESGRTLRAQIYDPIITVSSGEETATVDLTARVFYDDEEEFDIQELRFNLVNQEGDWLVRRVETLRTFGR